MSLLTTIASAFKGGGGAPMPLARSTISPWAAAMEGGAPAFDYARAVRHAFLDNPVAQRSVRVVADGIGGAPITASDPQLAALVQATSAGQSLVETLTAQMALHGNAYVQIARDAAGQPVELYALRPERVAGQAQKEFTVNESFARIDSLLHAAVEGEVADPPASPSEGECWIVASPATGAWAGREQAFAAYTSGGWVLTDPMEGMQVFDKGTSQFVTFRNDAWQRAQAPTDPSGGTTVDAEARFTLLAIVTELGNLGVFPAS